jgi:Rad3-related DNA helicase
MVCKDVGSSFDFERQTRVLVPTFLPEPRDSGRQFEERFGDLLVELFMASGGRGMALFTSYEMMNTVYPAVKERLEAENMLVLGQGKDGSRDGIAALFQRDITSVLLATQSFWEGVDFAGETLSLLVIAKLPFHVFTEPIIQARCELLEARGLAPFLHYSLPSAVIRLKQGFGRLIRTKTDRGIVVIADRRLVTQRYGQAFLRSLPRKAEVFGSSEEMLQAVREFFGEAK